MTRKELLALEFPTLTEKRYEIRCQNVYDGLAIAFYQMHELVVRTWLGKEQFRNIIEETKKESKKIISDLFYALPHCINTDEFYIPEEDGKQLNDFFKEVETGVSNISRLQRKIKNAEKSKRMKECIKRESKRVRLVTHRPKNYDKWLEKQETVFVHEKKKKDKVATATCAICHGTWETTKDAKEWDDCPHCKAHGQYRKNRIRTNKYEHISGSYIGKNEAGELVECIRNCVVVYKGNYLERSVDFYEGDRRLVSQKNGCYEKHSYGYKKSYKLFNRRGDFFHPYSEHAHIYPRNLKMLFKGTEYEKYEPEKIAKFMEKTHRTWFITEYIHNMEAHPLAERVMKGGLREMIYDLMLNVQYDIVDSYINKYLTKENPNTSLAMAMGITKTQLNAIRKSSYGQAEQVAIAAAANLLQPETPMEVIETYTDVIMNSSSKYSCLGTVFTQKEMMTIPFARYLKKFPKDKQRSFLRDYKDYLRWMEVLEYKPIKSRLRPKDFQKAHDQMEKEHADYLEEQKKELLKKENEYMMEIQPIVEQLFKIPLLKEQYEIVVPSCRNDLVNESEKLHHCVRNYSNNIYEHKCVIVFVRKREKIDEPFYTMEITKDFNIQQCRTYNNDSFAQDKTMTQLIIQYATDIKKRASMEEYSPLIEKLQFSIAA